MEKFSDKYYVDKVRSGDAAGFSVLLERYGGRVYSLIARIVGSREDAEELTQDVFLKVFRSLVSFRQESTFSTWIYHIAYNTAVSAARRKKCEYIPFDEDVLAQIPDDDMALEEMDCESRMDYLARALDMLPADEKAILLLFYKEEKSMAEIAKILGTTEGNTKVKIFRIRKKLLSLVVQMERK